MSLLSAVSPREHPDRFAALAAVVFLLRGIALLCVLPPFEGWDEYQHVAYIEHVAQHGRWPLLGDPIDSSLLRNLARFPQCDFALRQIRMTGAKSFAAWWQDPQPGRCREDRFARIRFYQAQHAPLFYYLAAPIFRLAGGTQNLDASVAAVRFFNIGLGAATIFLLARWGLGRLPSPYGGLWALLLSLQPLWLMNVSRVANDALAFLLATGVILLVLQTTGQARLRRWLLLGALTGGAILAKTINLALIPFVVGSIALAAARGRMIWKSALAAAPVFMLGMLVLTIGYFLFNLHHYGMAVPMQEALAGREAGRGLGHLVDAAMKLPWMHHLWTIWVNKALMCGGWSFIWPHPAFERVHSILIAVGLVAALIPLFAFIRHRGPQPGAFPTAAATPMATVPFEQAILVILCYMAALAWHAVQNLALHLAERPPSMLVGTLPWYTAVAAPWLLLLVIAGFSVLRPWRLGVLASLLLAVLFILTTLHTVIFYMVPRYSALPVGWAAIKRLAQLQPAVLGTATLLAAATMTVIAAAAGIASLGRDVLLPNVPQGEAIDARL